MAAYNPLIPQGSELVATVMFEIDDPVRRARCCPGSAASRTACFSKSPGSGYVASPTRPARTPAPRARRHRSSFSDFPSPQDQIARFRTPGARVIAGFDHPNYGHMAVLPEPVRAALAEDFD